MAGLIGSVSEVAANSWFVGNAEIGFLLAGCRAGREQAVKSSSDSNIIRSHLTISTFGESWVIKAVNGWISLI
jgi:hypothetical protein